MERLSDLAEMYEPDASELLSSLASDPAIIDDVALLDSDKYPLNRSERSKALARIGAVKEYVDPEDQYARALNGHVRNIRAYGHLIDDWYHDRYADPTSIRLKKHQLQSTMGLSYYFFKKSMIAVAATGRGKSLISIAGAVLESASTKVYIVGKQVSEDQFLDSIVDLNRVDWVNLTLRQPFAQPFIEKAIGSLANIRHSSNRYNETAQYTVDVARQRIRAAIKARIVFHSYITFSKLITSAKARGRLHEEFGNSLIVVDESHVLHSGKKESGGTNFDDGEGDDYEEVAPEMEDPAAEVEDAEVGVYSEEEVEEERSAVTKPGKRATNAVYQKIYHAILDTVKVVRSVRLLLLSATPLSNSANELVDLINLFRVNEGIRRKFKFETNPDSDGVPHLTKATRLAIKQFATAHVSIDLEDQVSSDLPSIGWPSADLVPPNASLETLAYSYLNLPAVITTAQGEQNDRLNEFVAANSRILSGVGDDVGAKKNYLETIHRGIFMSNLAIPGIQGVSDINRVFRLMNSHMGSGLDACYAHAAKLMTVINYVRETKGRILIYTRYLNSGVYPLIWLLETILGYRFFDTNQRMSGTRNNDSLYSGADKQVKGDLNWTYAVISGMSSGKWNQKEARRIARSSTDTRVKVFIVTKASSESLDAKKLRAVHIVDPWFNLSATVIQPVGRAIRINAAAGLPYAEQNATVYVHLIRTDNATKKTPGLAVDDYMYRAALRKYLLIREVEDIFRMEAADCKPGTVVRDTRSDQIAATGTPLVLRSDTIFSRQPVKCSHESLDLESVEALINEGGKTILSVYSLDIESLGSSIIDRVRNEHHVDVADLVGKLKSVSREILVVAILRVLITRTPMIVDGVEGVIVYSDGALVFSPSAGDVHPRTKRLFSRGRGTHAWRDPYSRLLLADKVEGEEGQRIPAVQTDDETTVSESTGITIGFVDNALQTKNMLEAALGSPVDPYAFWRYSILSNMEMLPSLVTALFSSRISVPITDRLADLTDLIGVILALPMVLVDETSEEVVGILLPPSEVLVFDKDKGEMSSVVVGRREFARRYPSVVNWGELQPSLVAYYLPGLRVISGGKNSDMARLDDYRVRHLLQMPVAVDASTPNRKSYCLVQSENNTLAPVQTLLYMTCVLYIALTKGWIVLVNESIHTKGGKVLAHENILLGLRDKFPVYELDRYSDLLPDLPPYLALLVNQYLPSINSVIMRLPALPNGQLVGKPKVTLTALNVYLAMAVENAYSVELVASPFSTIYTK